MSDTNLVATDVDLEHLRSIYREAREHDQAKQELRREGESLIVAYKLAGVDVKVLMDATELSHQRIYQILNSAGAGSQQRKRPEPEPEFERTFTLADLVASQEEESGGRGP